MPIFWYDNVVSTRRIKVKKEKKLYIVIAILAVCLVTSIIINCNQTAKLKNGEEVVVKVGDEKITADNLYSDLKEKYSISILVNEIDHILFDSKYKTDDTEKKTIENEISSIKANYQDEETYLQAIKTYYGVSSEEEFKDLLSLEYKRNLAVNDYVKEKVVTDQEIQNYYDTKIIGDIKASHILIKSNASDSDSQETKTKKEEEAKKKAEEIIAKLKDGQDFAKLAKKYSEDEGTKEDGGNLGYFNNDDNYEENFVAAAASLETGKFTEEPIKTEYGYEIILKVDEKDKAKLDDVKDTIKTTLAEEKLKNDSNLYYNSLSSIREDEKVEFKDNVIQKKYNNYLEKLLTNSPNEKRS